MNVLDTMNNRRYEQSKLSSYLVVSGRAFSLVELVVVIVIIGIIAAIAVPRFSAATENANRSQATASAAVLQNALDLFLAEHPDYALTEAGVLATALCNTSTTPPTSILTAVTNKLGVTNSNSSDLYGPYIRSIPSNQIIHPTDAIGFSAGMQGGTLAVGWAVKLENNGARIGLFDALGTDTEAIWP